MPLVNQQNFLTDIVHGANLLANSCPKQLMVIKNTISEIIYCSKSYATFLGLTKDHIIGKKTIKELYTNPKIEANIISEDQIVISSRNQLRVLKINKISGLLKPYMCIKSPIINPVNNQVAGVLLQGFEISIINLNQHISQCYSRFDDSQNTLPRQQLSKRERQIIFFFLAQLSSQEIANVLYKLEGKKVSKSTIDSIFNEQLYNKFNVNSRIALRDKLQYLGYDRLIPSAVLSTMSTPLNVFSVF